MGESLALDVGIFIQTVMLLAKERGLDSCPQVSWSIWPKAVRAAQDQVMSIARDYARRILKCAPLAIQATKQCALQGRRYPSTEEAMPAQMEHRFDGVETMLHSEDIREGLQAFMDKRKPQWQGR